MKYYVKINGVSSETIQGLKISELPSISKPLCRSTREEIDGRDGDIITKLGYSAYDKTLKIGLWGNHDINQVIAFFNQEGKITFSNEPDKYYIFTILNRADFINQLEAFRTASITIHCQPFKYMEQPSPDFDREYVEETGTDLTFNNSVEAPIDIDLKGNTSQNTLSGKNLCGFADGEQTVNNIKATYTNGVINLKGTANANGFIQIPLLQTIPAGTYCLSANNTQTIGNSTNLSCLRANNEGGFQCNLYTLDANNAQIYNSAITFITIRVANGTIYNDFKITPQIEVGLNKTAYEEYCGGMPSPNPSYPQNVNVVSGDNEIEVENSTNVFSMRDYASNNSAYYSYSRDNGLIMLKNDDRAFGSINLKINVEGNKTYYLKTTSNLSFAIAEYNLSDTWIKNDNLTSETRTFTTNANCSYIKFKCSSSGLTYPYTVGNIYISQNNNYEVSTYNIDLPVENLFQLPNNETKNDITFTKNDDGTFNLSGTATAQTSFILFVDYNEANIKDGKTYTFSANKSLTSGVSVRAEVYNNTTWVRAISNELSSTAQTTTGTANLTGGNKIRYSIWVSNGTQVNITNCGIQLEEGSKANTFTPYGTTPIELRKIVDYQDYFYKEDDKWYLHKEIGKVVLNGSENNWDNWQINNETANTYLGVRLLSVNNLANISSTIKGYLISNFFIDNEQSSLYSSAIEGVGTAASNLYFKILKTTANSLTNFKTWLNTHNTIVNYVLSTPTNTEITYQPLLNQLNALEQAQSKEGTTNIYQVNNDLPFIITASVLCGAAKFVVNNIGNTIAKPVMTIEGSGNIGIYLNDIQIFTISLGDEGSITLDIANMEAYKDGILKNRLVVGDYNSFVLQPGNNTISFSGDVVECEIKNYSRWL